MIDRREILDIAGTLGLLPHVVEKDYVLGWILAGIYQQTALAKNWIFKGGTCLKKCYVDNSLKGLRVHRGSRSLMVLRPAIGLWKSTGTAYNDGPWPAGIREHAKCAGVGTAPEQTPVLPGPDIFTLGRACGRPDARVKPLGVGGSDDIT